MTFKNMKVILNLIVIFLWLCLSFSYVQAQQGALQPNIVWIVSEDNSPLIGAYGDRFATTPHLDNFASQAVLYENAFATSPVCAPARSTLITGVYPSAMGTQHMRSNYPVPEQIKFFPKYLKEKGYYTTNNDKKDYNTIDQPDAWDESSSKATYKNRKAGQPFFAVFNIFVSHESSLHTPMDNLQHDPEKVPVPPYHPLTPEVKYDWAQYYDKISLMDKQVGTILKELEEAGLADNTIVFYYSDHGGALGRSKRFMYESGLRVPLIIRFPKKFKHLAPGKPGTRTDRIVDFSDFAPTMLSLTGIPIPEYMQGKAFLGKQQAAPRQYANAFRGRMDERIDMVRSVRDKKYRYIRNYLPHKPYAQYIDYLWRAPSMRSWEAAYQAGTLNEVQSEFWQSKPVEELFDTEADPHNVHNLAQDPQYREVLERMRRANREWLLQTKDVGFIPEAMMAEIAKEISLYQYARSGAYALEKIMKAAETASSGSVKEIRQLLNDQEAAVRYWAATGCTIAGKKAAPAKGALIKLLQDPEIAVRIAAAEALYHLDEPSLVLSALREALRSDNRMARVQALNVLDSMGPAAAPLTGEFEAWDLKNMKGDDYDKRAAQRILDKLQ